MEKTLSRCPFRSRSSFTLIRCGDGLFEMIREDGGGTSCSRTVFLDGKASSTFGGEGFRSGGGGGR